MMLYSVYQFMKARYKAGADYQVTSFDAKKCYHCSDQMLIRNVAHSTISVISVAGLPGVGMSMDRLGPLGWRNWPLLCWWFRCIPWTLSWAFQGHIRSFDNMPCPSKDIWTVLVVWWITLCCWGRASAVGSGFGTQDWTLIWEGAVSK